MNILLTGGNKGIGFAIIQRLLADKRVGSIYFTSRSKENAIFALNKFSKHNSNNKAIEYLQLDLLDQKSKESFIQTIEKKQLKFDTVVHNAGVLFPGNLVNEKIIKVTLATNLLSPMELTLGMLNRGLICPKGKIVFISSTLGHLDRLKKHKEAYTALSQYQSPEFRLEMLNQQIERYKQEIFDPKYAGRWPASAYAVSKLFLTIFAETLTHEPIYNDYKFYSCCPGWCQTDMTKNSGAQKTAYQGAETPAYLILEDLPQKANGKFFYELKQSTIS